MSDTHAAFRVARDRAEKIPVSHARGGDGNAVGDFSAGTHPRAHAPDRRHLRDDFTFLDLLVGIVLVLLVIGVGVSLALGY